MTKSRFRVFVLAQRLNDGNAHDHTPCVLCVVAGADLNTVAANSIDDTLKACLARIPDVATAGQRLLAEQKLSRGRENETRGDSNSSFLACVAPS